MAQPSHHPIAAIVSLDLHGYSRLTEQDEFGTHRALMNCWRKYLTPVVGDHRGVIVKSTGDGALIHFSDAPAAVKAMVRFQEEVTAAEAAFPEPRRLIFRVGIHLAPTIQEDGDLFGHGVNLAVRLQETAEPGAIFLSKAIFSDLDQETKKVLKNIGTRRFKNIGEQIRVYCWHVGGAPSLTYLRPALARAAVLLFLALIMPDATSGNIENMSQDLDIVLGTTVQSDGISREPGTEIAAIVDPPTPKSAFATPPAPDLPMIANITSAISARESAEINGEWIRPYHGLIAGPLTTSVRTTLAAAERSLESRMVIAEDAYLQALALYGRHTPSAFAKAIDELDHALTLQPDYSAAHALLAALYWSGLQSRWQLGKGMTRATMLGLAERHLTFATKSDPLVDMVASEMLTARGRHDLAIERTERLMALSPESAIGNYAKGRALLFAGRAVEAEGPIRTAIRLDPHAPRYLFGLALVQFNLDRFADAKRTLARVTARNNDDDWPHLFMAATQGHLGLKADARQAIGRFDRLSLERRGWFASQIPYVHSWPFQDDKDRDRLHLGLVLAGMPESPH